MAAIGSKATITGAPTNSAASSWFGALYDYLTGLFGADGTLATARKTLLAPGTAGKVLTSNGVAADPTWEVLPSAGGVTDFFFVASPVGTLINVTGDGTRYKVPFPLEYRDTGGNLFNTETYTFTTDRAGVHLLNVYVNFFMAPSAPATYQLELVTPTTIYSVKQDLSCVHGTLSLSVAHVVNMAGDEIYVRFTASGTTKDVCITDAKFSGVRIMSDYYNDP